MSGMVNLGYNVFFGTIGLMFFIIVLIVLIALVLGAASWLFGSSTSKEGAETINNPSDDKILMFGFELSFLKFLLILSAIIFSPLLLIPLANSLSNTLGENEGSTFRLSEETYGSSEKEINRCINDVFKYEENAKKSCFTATSNEVIQENCVKILEQKRIDRIDKCEALRK